VSAPALDATPHVLPWFARVLWAYIRRELAAVAAYRAAAFTRLAGFAMMLVSLVFFARFMDHVVSPPVAASMFGGHYLGFAAVGFVAAGFQQVGVAAVAQRIRWSQVMGTLEAELASPAPSWMVLGVAPAYEFGASAIRAAAYLWAATIVLRLPLLRVNVLALVLSGLLVIAAFVGLGLVAAATTMLLRKTNPVALVLGSLSFMLSGVIYPVSVLPPWLRAVSQLLPLTHALHALRGSLLAGASPVALREPLLALAVFAVVLIPAGTATFAYALKRARTDGSLGHY
jgi:ABC-2 type transport system permease protein